MTQTKTDRVPAASRGGRLPLHVRIFARPHGALPAPACGVRLERDVRVPMPDGVTLLADHYWPVPPADGTGGPAPTVLIRCPYGRGFPYDFMYGGMFAQQGFHVILQSCRGTGGSGGVFEPFVNEAADGQATVAWLRGQDWFSGSLGMIGASYLGFVQWALAADPPPELKAMVVQVSSDDFYRFLYPGGAFALEASFTALAAMVSQHRGFGAFVAAMVRLLRHHKRVERTLPLTGAYPPAVGGRVEWFDRYLAHPAADDPFWDTRRVAPRLPAAPPVSLLGGWHDVCVDPTLDLYQRLRSAGREVRLTVGPWNHTSGFNKDMPIVFGEALRWFREHLLDEADAPGKDNATPGRTGDLVRGPVRDGDQPSMPVRVWVGATGAPGQWRDLADWPPPGTRLGQWRLSGDGTLTALPSAAEAAPRGAAHPAAAGGDSGAVVGPADADTTGAHAATSASRDVTAFRYDPRDPTPSVGGISMDSNNAGSRRNDELEARADVVTFTGAPLDEPLEIAGPVSLRLRVRGSTPHFDLFARLCDVDPAGHSWNICDGLLRLSDVAGWTEVTVPMSSAAHRFGTGHRVRVQLSGGAHPRFMRNTGTGEPFATAMKLVPVDIEISHAGDDSPVLTLPVPPGGA
jgi:uncharacterized protein